MKPKVTVEVTAYEVNGSEDACRGQTLKLQSHWNRGAMVVVQIGSASLTVEGDVLLEAVKKAMNR